MSDFQSIRTAISDNKDELVIYAADNFSQFPHRDTSVTSKSDRVLASARSEDLIVLRGEKVVLIEPFLNVTSTPNDQWVVDRDGKITHIGMLEQVCEEGMVHIGSLKGAGPARNYDHGSSKPLPERGLSPGI